MFSIEKMKTNVTNVTERYVLLLLVLVFGFVGTYSNISTNQKKIPHT